MSDFHNNRKTFSSRAGWLRQEIAAPRGLSLRVLLYARSGTDEQWRLSVTAQYNFLRAFLEAAGVAEIAATEINDEALSGELRSRPGINAVWEGIETTSWSLILVEDSSRLNRDEVALVKLVRCAVDRGVRVICIGDMVDAGKTAARDQ